MTSQHGRLYALALALVVFFLAWAVIAAHPWATASADPRLRTLAVREAQLQREAKLVRKVVAARWARYRVRLKARRALIARVNAAAAQAARSGTGGYGRHARGCARTGREPAARPRGHEDVVKTDPTFWLLARASGLTAYGLLTASVLAGLVLKSKPFGRALKPAPTMDVHRFLALLGLGMLVLHGATLLLDRTLHMPLAGLFVPGASPYRPAAVAAGVVAAELMALIYVSFALRKRIGPRNWRRLHWATYLVFLLATVHGFASGTDSTQPWAHDLYLGAVGAVAFATTWRALGRPTRPAPERSL